MHTPLSQEADGVPVIQYVVCTGLAGSDNVYHFFSLYSTDYLPISYLTDSEY